MKNIRMFAEPKEKPAILIVEGTNSTMETIASHLAQAAYTISRASSGMQALELLAKTDSNYHVVVTPNEISDMSGIELVERIKTNPRLKRIPVIIATASSEDQHVSEGIKAGVYYYLTAPYGEKTLISIISAAVKECEQRRLFENYIRQYRQTIGCFISGEIQLRTLEEAQQTAFFLACLFPDQERASMGLYELMVNAVEHGNLEIGYTLKTSLTHEKRWEQEIERRLKLPEYISRRVSVTFENKPGQPLSITIRDDGKGFDFHKYLSLEPSRATDNHGRGIAKANLLSFDKVEYLGNGNTVRCVVKRG